MPDKTYMKVSMLLHNTLTKSLERFVPGDEQSVSMYVCGPTVYDCIHIGNARAIVVFDVLFRLLRKLYPNVKYVRNITDVDDKINAKAKSQGKSIAEVTETTTEWFHSDISALNVLPPTIEPRATDHIEDMIGIISRLISLGHAYENNGSVFFSTHTYKDHGTLSGRFLSSDVVARIEENSDKKNQDDFVLWKPSSNNDPGWDSPWGKAGRDGTLNAVP